MNRNLRSYLNPNDKPTQFLGRVEQIQQILECFDFDTVKRAMDSLGWVWASVGRTPNVEEMRLTAERLLNDVWEEPITSEGRDVFKISTGGFTAALTMFNGIRMLSLEFIISEWSVEYDEATNSHETII